MALDKWMADYSDVPLGKIHMPGAHDAGTSAGHVDFLLAWHKNSVTQSLPIWEQLNVGTRFFDLRLKKAFFGGKVTAHHTTGGMGAYSSETFSEILDNVRKWWNNGHQTEVAIFRISHTDPNVKAEDTIRDSVGMTALHTGTGNLCLKTIGEIASDGGIVCILEEGKFKIDQKRGIHSFTKYEKKSENTRGITCCGCYKGVHKLHEVMQNGLKGQYLHNRLHGTQHKHLWQLYWQKTYLNPFTFTGIENGTRKDLSTTRGDGALHGGTHKTLGHMIKTMQGLKPNQLTKDLVLKSGKKDKIQMRERVYSTHDFRGMTLPNIISYDFVNDEQNQEIIDLNLPNLEGF